MAKTNYTLNAIVKFFQNILKLNRFYDMDSRLTRLDFLNQCIFTASENILEKYFGHYS